MKFRLIILVLLFGILVAGAAAMVSELDASPYQTFSAPLPAGDSNGSLYVTSYPTGATILITGTDHGMTNQFVNNLPAGVQNLTLTKSGYLAKTLTVKVPAGDVKILAPIILIKGDGVVTPAGNGFLYVASYPKGATILIDGTDRGMTDQMVSNVPSGNRTLTLTKEGYSSYTTTVNVRANDAKILAPVILTKGGNGTQNGNGLGTINVQELIATYGPTLVFHPEEQFFLDNVDNTLGNSQILWGLVNNESDFNNFRFGTLGVLNYATFRPMNNLDNYFRFHEAQWYLQPNFRYFLNIPDSLKPGDLSTATTYVRVLPVNESVDLQFWFWSNYNGHGQSWVRLANVNNFYVPDSTEDNWMGRHYGDWEHVTLRFNVSDGSPNLSSVFFSEHEGGYWYLKDQLEYDNITHPIVYVARFTHANYPHTGKDPHSERVGDHCYSCQYHCYKSILPGHLDIWLVDFTGNGQKFYTWKPGGAEIVSSALSGMDIVEPDWLGFKKSWGQYLKSELHETIYAGDIIPLYHYNMYEVSSGPSGPAMKKEWSTGDISAPPVKNSPCSC